MIKTKEVFLSKLRNKLEKTNIEKIDSIIETYESIFNIAEKAYIKDKDTIAKLGSIKKIIKKFSINKKEESNKNGTSTNDKKDVLKNEDIQTNFEVENKINRVKVFVIGEDVKVSLYDGRTVKFKLADENLKEFYDITNDKKGNITFKRKVFKALKGSFSSECCFARSVEVFIPRSMRINRLEINSIKGDVFIDYISTKDVMIDSVCGNVKIGSIYNNSLKLNSISGHVDIDDLNSSDVRLFVCSGNIYINRGNIRRTYFETITGDISVANEENIGTEFLQFSSFTGILKLGDNIFKESFNKGSKRKTKKK